MTTLSFSLTQQRILLCGGLAVAGAAGGVVADVLSLWIPAPDLSDAMRTDPAGWLMNLLAAKSSADLWWGSLLGILLLPLHLFGFFLMTAALRPARPRAALLFLISSGLLTTVGAGFHGSIALVGEAARSGESELFMRMMDLFFPWWWIMTAGFVTVSILLMVCMQSASSLYPRWTVWVSPLPFTAGGAGMAGLLLVLDAPSGLIWFLAICGLNLPLLIFHAITTGVMLKAGSSVSGPCP
jgi:hypothetical protein